MHVREEVAEGRLRDRDPAEPSPGVARTLPAYTARPRATSTSRRCQLGSHVSSFGRCRRSCLGGASASAFCERTRTVERAPTMPACMSGGCWHPDRRRSDPSARVGRACRTPDLAGKRVDVDRLRDVAGEARLGQPLVTGIESAGPSPRRPGCAMCAARPEHPGGLRAIEIGQAQVHQDDVGQVLGREGDAPRSAVAASTRPKPGHARARRERASGSCRCRRRSGRAGRADITGVFSAHAHPASCSPRITTSSAKASGACSTRSPASRSRPSAGTSTRCSRRSTARRRTSWSPTSGCRRVIRTRGSRPPGDFARRNPGLGVVVLSQYADPSYALALLDTGSAGRAYVLKERVHDLDQLAGRRFALSRRAAR